jgi:clathrin heavy chain
MQLHSLERNASQFIEGYTGAFITFNGANLLCFSGKAGVTGKLTIIPIGGTPGFQKRMVDIALPPDAQAQDFPFNLQISDKYGVIFVVTKMGYIYLFEIETATQLYMNRISAEPIFLSAIHSTTNGLLGLNRKGQLLLVAVDPATIVPFCTNTLNNYELGIRLAARANLPGAESLFEKQFAAMLAQGNYTGAAQLAAQSPQGILRTAETINRFKQLPHVPPSPPPLLMYFNSVMEKNKLNKLESLELARIVVSQGKHQLLEKWIQEEKIECSEDLGDVVANIDANMALSIYLRAKANDKVIQAFISMHQYDKILKYTKHVNYTPDYYFLLQNIVALDPAGASVFAQQLANNEGGTLLEWGRVADVFISRNMIKEATSFLLDVLKGNRPEDADLQTRLLEINLHTNPQVANYILSQNLLSHYNRLKIAQLCERAGLYQRALEHYTDLVDVKRCIVNTHAIQPEFLVEFFRELAPEDGLSCLKELLRANQQQNMQVVVQVATKYSDVFGIALLMKMFEEFNCWKGLYYYLGAICVMSQDPDVHFKYIEAAVKCGQLKDVERHTRESDFYDAKRAAAFLMEMKLPDQRPLINVCDRFNMITELTSYLFSVNQVRVLEVYCKQVNPLKTPLVVGSLLDKGCDEKWLMETVMAVGNMCPAEDLVREVEERGRLKLILPWLEARQREGSTEPSVYNALAKIYVDNNQNPERFLEENNYYDSLIVGKYCEKRDPILAYLAYKKNNCDDELITVTNKNGLFKQQAAYLVDRSDEQLWAKVLVKENTHMRHVIDQVVGVILPQCRDAAKVGSTVKAFMTAELPHELIELLEKIVLHGTDFAQNENLQNLLILTAIKADTTRVMDYIHRLDNYHGMEIASIAVSSELYEEAFAIYTKFNFPEEAIKVLINYIRNIPRAEEYAEKVNLPAVWALLARAQLAQNPPMIKESITSFIKAKDPSEFLQVAQAAERAEIFAELIPFLQMARKGVKEAFVDNSLIYAYAKIDQLAQMEEFINQPNVAKLSHVGERLFDEQIYKAARIIFNVIPDFGRLATSLVRLGEFTSAVDSARKAKSHKCWREVMISCLDHDQYKLAQICGVNLIVSPDDLEMVVHSYEVRGLFNELISLLENGTNLDRAHMGIFTELGIQFAKHRPAKLMDHLQLQKHRINTRKLQRVCEMCRHWPEVAFLFTAGDEYDSAITTMIDHPSAWEHGKMRELVAKVSNTEYVYRAAMFYLEYHPLLLVDLLKMAKTRLDHGRVVADVKSKKQLPLVREYLEDVQEANSKQVNNALNNLYVEEELVEKLRESINTHDNFDQIGLAQDLEKHSLLEFRRVAATIYKNNQRWAQSVALSKQDKLYRVSLSFFAVAIIM